MMVGDRLSHFVILEFLVRGGFGEVYRARDTLLDRQVAIKVLPAALSADPVGRARFRREARAASRLTHPNICTIYEFGEQGERAFIAMELVAGRTLKDHIAPSLDPLKALDGRCCGGVLPGLVGGGPLPLVRRRATFRIGGPVGSGFHVSVSPPVSISGPAAARKGPGPARAGRSRRH